MGLKKIYAMGWLVLAVLLFITPTHAQFSGSGSGGGTFTGPFPGNPIDPTILYGAGNNIGGTGTTADTHNGTNSITNVANTTNWTVGRGIAVTNVQTGGTYAQNGCIGSIAGTTFTIVVCGTSTPVNAPSSQTGMAVATDDTYPLQLAINFAGSTHRPIRLQGILFITTSTLVIDDPITFIGAGKGDGASGGTTIGYWSTTNDIILVKKGATLSDFWLIQVPSPTTGYAINVTPVPAGLCSNIKPNIQRVAMYFTHAGVRVGIGVEAGVFKDILVQAPIAEGVYYASQTPCGDNLMDNIVSDGDFLIYANDTTMFNNLKILPGNIFFIHESFRARFNNISLEGPAPGCAVDFGGAYISGLNFNGGEIAGYLKAFCNTQQALSTGVSNIIGNSNGTSCVGGSCGGGTGILNYIFPAPVFSGCGTNGTPIDDSDLTSGVVTMSCTTGQNMVITHNEGPTSVYNNGLLCEVFDLTNPGTLFRQQSYANLNNGTTASWSSATFAVPTAGVTGDVLKYKCKGF